MGMILRIKKIRHDFYRWRFAHLPVQENKILLWADNFKHYGCSPKYIAKYLMENYPHKFDFVWVFDTEYDIPDDLPKEIRVVRYFSIEYLREIATSKFIVCNTRTGKAHYFDKRPEQIYIQTWHSSLRLKKIEGDVSLDQLSPEYVELAKNDSKKIDLLLSGCEFSTKIFERAFWYTGQILKSGTPRCDILLNDMGSIKKKVYQYYNISSGTRLALYAPTFRNDKKADAFGMDFLKLGTVLKNVTNEEWKIGCRLHPNIREEYQDNNCISMTKYSDMQELIVAADILITDYSSCMFDMAIAKKPCILYAPDLEQYMQKERGLYFDIKQLPFPIAKNMKQLCDIISNFDKEKYFEDLQNFMKSIGSYEKGTAAKQVAEYILDKIN